MRFVGLLCGLLAAAGCGTDSSFDAQSHIERRQAYDVTIERDRWGVPHIRGETNPDVAFGLAYAHSEDSWEIFEQTVPFYRAENGLAIGVDGAVTDYLVHLLGVDTLIADRYASEVAPDVQRYVQGYVDGLNYFAARHPERVSSALLPIRVEDVIAGFVIRHLLFYGFDGIVRDVMNAELPRELAVPPRPTHEGRPIGSNAIAVSPRASSDGSTMLMINSHQPTTGPVAWYEARLTSDEGLYIQGGLFPGSPLISLGFTPDIAWGVTVNQPDLVDVYQLEIHPEDDLLYRHEGEWLSLETQPITIRLKLWGWLPWSSEQVLYRSVHGPVLRAEHGTFALRYAGGDQIRQVEQWYRMNTARDWSEWSAAMRIHSFASFNFVYADRDGNIAFLHNARMPVRAPGWDFSRDLPGDRAGLIWQEVLPFDALPQVVNPTSGYLVSANQTPFQVSAPQDNPVAPEQGAASYPTRMTNRAHRGLELIETLAPISFDEFRAIKHDKAYSRSSRVSAYLEQARGLSYPQGSPYAQALTVLQAWDLNTDIDNPGAALGVCLVAREWLAERAGQPPPAVQGAFEACADQLMQHVGRVNPPWGSVNRHRRGDVDVPVGGGPDTLRAIYGEGLEEDGVYTNIAGDGLYYLVSWAADGSQRVEGIHHFGSNVVDEQSPHFSDQAHPFAQERLRDVLAENQIEPVRSYQP